MITSALLAGQRRASFYVENRAFKFYAYDDDEDDDLRGPVSKNVHNPWIIVGRMTGSSWFLRKLRHVETTYAVPTSSVSEGRSRYLGQLYAILRLRNV